MSIPLALALLASAGCASASRLPWKQIKPSSVKMGEPLNNYGVGGRATGRLPWSNIKPASRKLARPHNDYGVGGKESKLPWPTLKP